jgi:formiminotetrahydrofolate cyclodeaminase
MATLEEFLRDLASAEPVPGGGSVAALQTAMGAALLAMVSDLTIGKKKYADVQGQVTQVGEQAESLRARALSLVDEDIRAFEGVARAMTLPRETDEEKAERHRVMQSALKEAAIPPLETMAVAVDVVRLARDLVKIGNRSAISDVGTAALSARAGYHAARLNVWANASSVNDQVWLAEVQEKLAAISPPDDMEREVIAAVEDATGGGAN